MKKSNNETRTLAVIDDVSKMTNDEVADLIFVLKNYTRSETDPMVGPTDEECAQIIDYLRSRT